jgi:hypothetical protein
MIEMEIFEHWRKGSCKEKKIGTQFRICFELGGRVWG